MLDPRSLDPCVEIVAHFILVVFMELSSQEGCDVFRFYGVDGRAGEVPIDCLEILLSSKNDVGCILSLHDTPMIAQVESLDDRAKPLCKEIEPMVQEIHFEGIAELLGLAKIRNPREHIVHESKRGALPGQLNSQPSVPIEIDLKAKGTPSGNTDITKPEVLINEIEVVVKTLAVSSPKEGLVGLLVVPGFVGLTRLHGGEDMHEAGVIASGFEDIPNPVFLSEILLPDELDLEAIFSGNLLGIVPEFITKGLGEARVIKEADVVVVQEAGHTLREAELGQGSLDYHTVKTGENSRNFLSVTFSQQHRRSPIPSLCGTIGVDIEQ